MLPYLCNRDGEEKRVYMDEMLKYLKEKFIE